MDKLDYNAINEEQEREFEQHQVVCQDIELRAMRKKIDELVGGYNGLRRDWTSMRERETRTQSES